MGGDGRVTERAPPIWQLAGVSPQTIALEDHRRRVSFGELEERTNAFGHGLEALGVAPGSHVALVASNRVEFVEALLGATRAGMVVTPVKTSWTAAEIEYVLRDAGTRALVTDVDAGTGRGARRRHRRRSISSAAFAARASSAGSRLRARAPCRATGGLAPLVHLRHHRPAEGRPPLRRRPTSVVRGVRRLALDRRDRASPDRRPAPERLGALPRRAARLLAVAPRERLYDAHPPALGRGGRARRARPRRALDVHGADHVPPAPRAARADAARAFRAPALRAVLHGGEPCPQHVKQQMIEWLGPVLIEYYGMTEGGLTIATPEDWLARPGTVGEAVVRHGACWSLARAASASAPASRARSTSFPAGGKMFEYRNAPEKTAAAYTPDGAFTVGDIGYVDEDGYLFISGRTADVIVSSGVNVYPAEIEDLR